MLTSLGQKERVLIESINYRLLVINIRDNTHLYIAKKPRRKENQKHLIRIKNEFRIRFGNRIAAAVLVD